jgi:hypothetical protein
MRRTTQSIATHEELKEEIGRLASAGEIPIQDALDDTEADELVAAVAANYEGPTLPSMPLDEDPTPSSLLGNHRSGSWATRDDEGDRGLDDAEKIARRNLSS